MARNINNNDEQGIETHLGDSEAESDVTNHNGNHSSRNKPRRRMEDAGGESVTVYDLMKKSGKNPNTKAYNHRYDNKEDAGGTKTSHSPETKATEGIKPPGGAIPDLSHNDSSENEGIVSTPSPNITLNQHPEPEPDESKARDVSETISATNNNDDETSNINQSSDTSNVENTNTVDDDWRRVFNPRAAWVLVIAAWIQTYFIGAYHTPPNKITLILFAAFITIITVYGVTTGFVRGKIGLGIMSTLTPLAWVPCFGLYLLFTEYIF